MTVDLYPTPFILNMCESSLNYHQVATIEGGMGALVTKSTCKVLKTTLANMAHLN